MSQRAPGLPRSTCFRAGYTGILLAACSPLLDSDEIEFREPDSGFGGTAGSAEDSRAEVPPDGEADPDGAAEGGSEDNRPPLAGDGSLVVIEGTQDNKGYLTANDPDSDVLTYTLGVPPRLGNVTVFDDGAFEYSSPLTQFGEDAFTFQVSDGFSTAHGSMRVTVVALGPVRAQGGELELDTWLGAALDIEHDTVVVGGHEENYKKGIAYVIRRQSSGSWLLTQKLEEPEPGPFTGYGDFVALNGAWLMVSAWGGYGPDRPAGEVHVYKRQTNGTFDRTQPKLQAGVPQLNDAFGWSLSLDGDVAAIGASGSPDATFRGLAYVFRRNSSDVWKQEAVVSEPIPQNGNYFARGVAIDGDTLAVGSFVNTTYGGSLYVFRHSNGSWDLEAELHPDPPTGPYVYGGSIALYGDKLLVGDHASFGTGCVHGYRRVGSTWVRDGLILPPDSETAPHEFGWRVALHGDTAIIGMRLEPEDISSAFVYRFKSTATGGTWEYTGRKLQTEPTTKANLFGFALAFDGTTAVFGTNREPPDNLYFFGIEPQKP